MYTKKQCFSLLWAADAPKASRETDTAGDLR